MIEHKFQRLLDKVAACADTDFAGRKRTIRSTSGGVAMFGNRCVKTYNQTQTTVALSSGESEFCGIAKATTMVLGVKGLLEGIGVGVEIQVNADSTAAKNVSSKRGRRASTTH